MPDFRVQRNLTTFGAAGPGPVSATVILTTAADPARAFPRLTGTLLTGAGRDVAAAVTLGNDDLGALLDTWTGADFRLQRNTSAELQNHRYYSEVVEDLLPAELRPFHGLYVRLLDDERLVPAQLTKTTAAVPGLSSLAQCLVWPIAVRSDPTGQVSSAARMTAFLDGLGQVQIDRGDGTGNATLSFAVVELGAAWSVRRVTLSTAVRGSDVPITGCGSEPWSRKLLVPSWRAPAGANDLADHPTLRANLAAPDEALFNLPAAGTAGTWEVSAYVISHAELAVAHLTSVGNPDADLSGTDFSVALGTTPYPPDETSVLAMADLDAANTLYPRVHWGYRLADDGMSVTWRRGRDAPRPSRWTVQVVRWPTIPRGGAAWVVGKHTATVRRVG